MYEWFRGVLSVACGRREELAQPTNLVSMLLFSSVSGQECS